MNNELIPCLATSEQIIFSVNYTGDLEMICEVCGAMWDEPKNMNEVLDYLTVNHPNYSK